VAEDLPEPEPLQEEEQQEAAPVTSNVPVSDRVIQWIAADRQHQRRVKSEKYKKLLEGNL
jgi:hypothetical protein